MFVEDCTSPAFDGCTFDGNQGALGGAIQIVECDGVSVANSRFVENLGLSEGGALHVQSSTFSIEGSEFEQNHRETVPVQISDRGGSAFVLDSSGSVSTTVFRNAGPGRR